MNNNIQKVFGFVSIVIISILISALVDGYIVKKLWSWFIVPIFELKALSLAQAYGLCMVFRALSGYSLKLNDEEKEFGEVVVQAVVVLMFRVFMLMPLLLLIGKFVKNFI